jgi:hypothetical protein
VPSVDGAFVAVHPTLTGFKSKYVLEHINQSVWIEISNTAGFSLLVGNDCIHLKQTPESFNTV